MNKFLKYCGVLFVLTLAVVSSAQSARGFRYRDDHLISTWAIEPVYQMYVDGIITGTPDGEFDPKGTLNRAEAAVIILRAKGITPKRSTDPVDFADVQAGVWYYDAIQEMVTRGWMKGNPNGTFTPARKLNKAEWFTLLYRAFEMEETLDYNDTKAELGFEDVTEAAWYSPAVRAFNKFGLHRSPGENFGPGNQVRRQDAAWTIYMVTEVDEFTDWYKESMEARERSGRIKEAYGLARRDPKFDPDLQGFDIEEPKVYYEVIDTSEKPVETTIGSEWEFIGTINIENTFDVSVSLGQLNLKTQFEGTRGDQSDQFMLQIVGEDIDVQEGVFSNKSDFFINLDGQILTPGSSTSVDVYVQPDPTREFFPNIEAQMDIRVFDLDGFKQGKNGFTSVATNDARDNRYFTSVRFTTPEAQVIEETEE